MRQQLREPPDFRAVTAALSAALVFTILMLASPDSAMAQVEWKDRYVTLAGGSQTNHSIARPSNEDYTVVVWEDYRNDEEGDIYAQLIENRNGIAVWFPVDGVPVCTASGEQRNPRAAYDTLGGVIITWEDYRDDALQQFDPDNSQSSIYAVRLLLSTGHVDPNWGSEKVVCDAVNSYSSMARGPRLVGIKDGAVITWTDYRNSTGYPYYGNRDVYAQYIRSADGGVNWTADGIMVHEHTEQNQQNPEIILDSIYTNRGSGDDAMGVVIAYEDDRVPPDKLLIYADRIDCLGQRVWGDLMVAPPTNEQISNYDQQVNHRMAPVRPDPADQHRGAIIVWQDKRDALNTKTDIYAQRVDIESGMSLWPTTNDPYGVQVCDDDEEQVNPKVDVDADVAAVAWEDDRNAQDWDIYGNGVNAVTGSLVDASGVAVCTESYDQIAVEVECKSDTATFCWEDYRRYPQSDIYAQEVNTVTWSYYWTGNGIPVTHAKTGQYKPEVGKRVFVYMDDRRDAISNDNQDDMNIYAQRMGDECDGPTYMHWKDELVKWTLDTDAQDHRFAKDEIGNTYVVWYEDRELPAYDISVSGVYIQKLDRDGVPRWLNGGILLSDTNNASGKPDVCIDGDGGAIASWHETVSGSNIVVVKNVNADGSIAWTGYPSTTPASNPRMVDDDNGGAYMAYESTADIRICRYDLTGNESFNNRFDFNATARHIRPLVVKDRLSGCYVAGYDDVGGMIRCAYANSGAVLATGDVLNIAPLESYDMSTDPIMNTTWNTYDAPLVASEGENIFAKKVRHIVVVGSHFVTPIPAGTVPADALLVAGSSPDYYLSMPVVDYDSVAVSGGGGEGGGAIVAWNKKYRSGPSSPVYYHKVYTTQVDWVTGTPAVVPRWPGWPMEVSMECFEETHPDIGKENKHDRMVNGQSNESCFGFIVWHEYSERSCAYKAIVAQEVDYSYDLTTNPPPEPRTWDPDGELLSPQSGAVNQYTPLLLVYPNDTATVYWMDTRAGDPVIAGTRLISHENEIALLKNTAGGGGTKPEAVFLSGNYPNPFNANQGTLIRFRLEEEAFVVLGVTDLLGREVAVLKSEYAPRGDHSVMFTPGDVPAGVYMYTLTAGNRAITRSMLLVR